MRSESLDRKHHVLLVEDEAPIATMVTDFLECENCAVTTARSLREARRHLEGGEVEVVLLDLTLPDGSGLDLLDFTSNQPCGPSVLVVTGNTSVSTAVEAVRRGAYDYLTKPFDVDTLSQRMRNAVDHYDTRTKRLLDGRMRDLEEQASDAVLLASEQMLAIREQVVKVARHGDMPVLVSGATGVGKEHVCRLIHELSPRSKEPFVAVNCATLEKSFLRSELFGHERGAFTGAHERRRGLFELASHGTLLLDEVSEMPPDVQAAFLRVLETRSFRRLGGSAEIKTRVRIVAATNKNLEDRLRKGEFREDLLFRLNTMEIHVPLLRERPEDIRQLADHFCARMARSSGLDCELTQGAHEVLARYPWPGNIRELKNVIERTVVVTNGGPIAARDLELRSRGGSSLSPAMTGPHDPASFPTLAEVEKVHIKRALELCRGNRTRAAKLLGVARSTLIRRLDDGF